MAPPARSKEDPIEKIGKLIDDRISAAFANRDQSEREKSDPWARLEGAIDRAVDKRLKAFMEELEGDEGEETGGKPRVVKNDDEGGEGLLGALGLK